MSRKEGGRVMGEAEIEIWCLSMVSTLVSVRSDLSRIE